MLIAFFLLVLCAGVALYFYSRHKKLAERRALDDNRRLEETRNTLLEAVKDVSLTESQRLAIEEITQLIYKTEAWTRSRYVCRDLHAIEDTVKEHSLPCSVLLAAGALYRKRFRELFGEPNNANLMLANFLKRAGY